MSTTSRCPCSTRRRISASTALGAAAARRAAHERDDAEVARERAAVLDLHERAHAVEPRVGLDAADRTDVAGDERGGLLAALRDDDDVLGQAGERVAAEVRAAAGDVDAAVRRAARAAALRLFATASFVTQHVLITATSASVAAPRRGRRASSRSRTSCASTCETLQPRKSTGTSPCGGSYVRYALRCVGARRPPSRRAPAARTCAKPASARLVRREVAGGDQSVDVEPAPAASSTASSEMFATTAHRARQPSSGATRRASTATPFARAFARVASTAASSMSTPTTGPKPSSAAGDREHARAAADVEQRARLERAAAARGRAASSGARRCRTRGPGRSRRRARPAAGASHGGPIQSAPDRDRPVERRASGPPTRPRRRPTARRRRRARAAPRRRRRCTRRARRRRPLDLLEPLREELEHRRRAPPRRARAGPRPRLAQPRGSAERALQLVEEALVGCGRSPRRSPRRTPRAAAAARRSAGAARATFTSTRWSPRPKPCSTGMPSPRSTRTSPGCDARPELELDRPVERLDLERRAERRLRRSSGRPARRCRCPRARSAGRAGRARRT